MQVVVEDLSIDYPHVQKPLIEHLNYIFQPGRITAIIGPSGSGKSTLLNTIGGLHPSYSGTLLLRQSPSSEVRANPGMFSWVLQANTVLSGRTALDNAALGLLADGYSIRDARRRAASALAALGLEQRSTAIIGELSGGEVQRVTIARCLLQAAPVILADEPTGQLDASTTKTVSLALRHAAEAGKTVIVATHDPAVSNNVDELIDLSKL